MIEADKKEINLQTSETEISQMQEYKYKSLVKNKIKEAAFKNLLEIKNNHSKMKNVVYQKHELQPYLCSPLFGTEDIEMLLALRTRTVRGVKSDFRGMHQDEECPLGCGNRDTLSNILTCPVLKNCFKSEDLINHKISYEDIFSPDIIKQKQVTELYIKLMNIRNNIMIYNNPVAAQSTGPCINLQRPSILSN